MGPIEQNIARQAIRAGQPIPDRIANAPNLIVGLQIYLTAFLDLDSERSHAMALAPIPWTSIRQYADAYSLDEEQTEDLIFLIKRLDNAHLARLAKKKPPGPGNDTTQKSV